MANKTWYLGLDIGSASVGWAATDTEYKIIRKNKKRLWGVRLFEEATTAEDRRGYRSSRRRLARRKWRLNLLGELFASKVKKVDENFFLRLKESQYHYEDKTHKVPYAIFNDKDYTDKDFYNDYPTIYHLRSKLMTEKIPDIRKVFLAIHHIIKNRGHFLLQGQSFKDGNLNNLIKELLELDILHVGFEVTEEVVGKIADISLEKKTLTDKVNDLKKLYPKEKQLLEVFRLIFGGKTSLDKLFAIDEYKELDTAIKSVSFKEKIYEEVRHDYEQVLSNYIELLDLTKLVYDSIILSDIKKEGKTLSESKVELYEKHRDDLLKLKNLVKNDSKLAEDKKVELYASIFKEDKDKGTNYVNYIRKSEEGKGCNYEDFKKFLVKELAKLEESSVKAEIIKDLELEQFLPLQRTKDNSVVPYQIHKEELVKILDNAAKYHNFLDEKDESGYSIREKVIQLLEFRIPYYVGPLNSSKKAKEGGFAWSVRNKGYEDTPVTPWNYSKVIDESASAEKFITNLTNKCTYLKGEDVLPKSSLLYSEFALLNELNALKYDGNRISLEARNTIIEKLFKQQGKKVTKTSIKNLLKAEGYIDGKGEITGIDITVKNDLKSYRDFKKILGNKFNSEHVENIILWITLYGESRKLIKAKIESVYGEVYSKDEITKMSRLVYKDWGRFSRKLLTELVSKKLYNEETGECLNIIGAMRQNNILFMELLADRFDYSKQIVEFNKELQEDVTEITPEILDDLYVSPAVKRSIWQTVRIVEELKKIIGCAPAKIFVETTRSNQEKKKPTDSRKKQLELAYKAVKKDVKELEKEIGTINFDVLNDRLSSVEPSKLKAKKLYLYYTQLGRCMYSEEPINISELFDNNKYDIDHIYPQSKIKDDSFTNTVLVKRESNAAKTDRYPLGSDIQTPSNRRFWKFLKEKGLISDEKYNRLVRTEEFSDEELSGFIARQLVETSQSVKAVASILGELNPETSICYSKAENVSSFRQNFGKIKDGNSKSNNNEQLVKVREINDYHHAKDAYLNIVVGNVYDTKFTRNVFNFIKDKKDGRKYSLNKVFYENVSDSKTVAWEMDKTIYQVEKVMNNNNILVIRRTSEQKGGLFDATVYKAKVAAKAKDGVYYPLKTSNSVVKDVAKYGGYTSIGIAYYSIFEYTLVNKKGEEKITRIIPIPIYISQNIKDSTALIEFGKSQIFCRASEKIKDFKLLYRRLCIGSKININNYQYYIGGKSDERFYYDSAIQVTLDKKSEKYLKILSKYQNWKKENKDGELWENITKENNIELYNKLVEKMNSEIFTKKKSNKYNELNSEEIRNNFIKISVEEQAKVLLEILNLLTNKKSIFDLKSIDIKAARGKISFNLTSLTQFSIIEQSITGFYEKEITIIGDKGNDMENNNS
ncbi:type II CRISPR RNA-guided endonuclease Cas9 [Gemella haemolysans]|uniref:type II CRISPR RNA-guided endonuclease Cas9 n=1 Tax=Gemella haemolysans TaxID=1379 RepID=UPI002906DED8|nr:type II CRISPR RNA-guided endonuclease Cas9 [Gemella haemolysans]MDU3831541.1 type II CRISPR RNA-guided endonuclease Cas9 [Gemella haemolysans]